MFALVVPLLAQAAFFSLSGFLKGGAGQSQASSAPFNSQTMPLLEPAKNIDPHPSTGGGDILVVDGSALEAQSSSSDGESEPAPTQISVYIVREGDTLSQIAEMFDVSVNTIRWANDIAHKDIVHPGQELIILPITGVRHTVAKGETLATLATKFKSDADEIASYNGLPPGATLSVGEVVIIPDGVIAPPPPSPTRSGSTASIRGAGGAPAASGYFGWPVAGGTKTQGLHGFNGIDIGAAYGTNIIASAGGTVIVARAGGYNGGYGSYVVIQHDNGTQTLYAHASQVLVSVGEQVSKGQTIAKMGATGKATGNHVHFEVRGAKNPF